MAGQRPSLAELKAVIQPPGLLERRSGEHWAGRWYMRRVSPSVTWVLVRAGFSANAVTGLMIVVGLAGAALVAVPALVAAVAAALLIQVYLLLDCCDGEVARWRRTQSPVGVYLDRLGHYLVEAGLMVGLGVRASAGGDALGWVVVGMAAALLVLVEKAETDLVDVARHRSGLAPAGDDEAVMTNEALATGRRLASFFPVHRITHAVEASLLIAAVAVVDAVSAADPPQATRLLMAAMLAATSLVAVLHLVSVLNSRRLTA